MVKGFNIGPLLGQGLSPPTKGPRPTAAPEVDTPTIVPGARMVSLLDRDPKSKAVVAKTLPGYIGPSTPAPAVPVSGIDRSDLAETSFRTVRKAAFTPKPLKKDSNMNYAETIAAALDAAGGRISRADLGTKTGFAGKQLENALTRARIAGVAHRDGGDVVAGKDPAMGKSKPAKKPRAKPTKRIARPSTVLAKAAIAKAAKAAKAEKPTKRAVRFIPCGPGADAAMNQMIADSTRAIITAERGAIIVVGDRVEYELTPAAMSALAKATAEVRA